MSEHIPNWHVTVWCPAGNALVGEVAGIMDENGRPQAIVHGGPDGVSEEDIKRARFIASACNSHYDLLAALEGLTPLGTVQTGRHEGAIIIRPQGWANARAAIKKVKNTQVTD